MKRKKLLILGIVLILMAIAAGVVFAGQGACNRCSCEKFLGDGEDIFGNRVCKCGHRFIAHGSIDY